MKPPKDIESHIGGALRAGCIVNPPNSALAIGLGAGAKSLGSATAGASYDNQVSGQSAAALPQPTGHWKAAYLALTDDALVLVELKQGLLASKVAGELARLPAGEVRGGELGEKGLQRQMRLELSDGSAWAFGVPKMDAGNAGKLLAELG